AEGSSRPMLRAFLSSGGAINNLYDLQGMAANLSDNYTLTQNIDASATAASVAAGNGDNYSDVWGGRGFAPVGAELSPFTGGLNGAGFVIDGLTINRPDQTHVGLFGVTAGASIVDVGLTDVDITGDRAVGSIVGQGSAAIANSYTTGEVQGDLYIGGLVGINENDGVISTSYADVIVTSSASDAGGLVGFNMGSVTDSYAVGTVTGSQSVGGLVGTNETVGEVVNRYALGAVSGITAGGLIGSNNNGT